jgi:phosphoadenosine phosphosulfate reductase
MINYNVLPARLIDPFPFCTAIMSPSTLSNPLKLPPSKEDLNTINAYLKTLSPQQILQWSIEHIPALYQTTAFGMTGLVTIDMLSKMMTSSRPPLVFLDTLYHFPETYELVEAVKARYNIPVIVYKPEGCATIQDFDSKYGEHLWERNEGLYDYASKVGTRPNNCDHRCHN